MNQLQEIDEKIALIWPELEVKIVHAICKKFKLEAQAYQCKIEELQEHYFGVGFCQVVWQMQKKILKKEYQIDWQSQQEASHNYMK